MMITIIPLFVISRLFDTLLTVLFQCWLQPNKISGGGNPARACGSRNFLWNGRPSVGSSV